MNKESLVKERMDYAAIGEQISHELATKMMKDHHDKYGSESNSYIIGCNAILKLLEQPGCVGIRFVEALNESGNKTLVYLGIDKDGKNIVEYSSVNQHGDIAITEGMIQDHTQGGISWFD